jgi:hypothetical protein
MVLEELAFVAERILDRLSGIDIALTSVDDRDVAQTKRDDATGENINDIGALVHQVDLCKDANGAASWIVSKDRN